MMCNPGKLKRLIEERERIIKEHDTGSVVIENGKVTQGGKKTIVSEAQQKVSNTSYPKTLLPYWRNNLCCVYLNDVKR
jgi:hypothetical protein